MNLKAYLQLTRPANIITAIADILAGVAIATFSFSIDEIDPTKVILLCISTIGLYGGGIVFNDIFDLELDTKVLHQLLKYNSPENIKLVYDEFIEETESLLSEIEPLINSEKIKGIGDKLHIIKGNSGTLGAMKIFNSVKQFEKNIKNNIFDNTLKDYLTLIEIVKSFKKHIQTIQAFNS